MKPDFLSIDIEGLDLSILKSLDFQSYRPKVIYVECVEFSTDHRGGKNKELVDFLLTKGYFIFGDTYINTIFCDTASFKSNQ
ncbi:MAG: FkbM family methyltransferase [Chitinophagaceae bacterium]|nr:FkbM family methyltransferase [Chitinophagaceae bacterium]